MVSKFEKFLVELLGPPPLTSATRSDRKQGQPFFFPSKLHNNNKFYGTRFASHS